ncbi:MAG: outer membrane beta-barrel domain-containing protein [Pseudobdellovibrio sp.]
MKKHLVKILFFALLTVNVKIYAQEQGLDDSEIISVEGMYNAQPLPKVNQIKKNDAQPTQLTNSGADNSNRVQEVKDLKDLNKLAPFREVSVIQKKFLPKTERFQLFVGASAMTNTPWYNNFGGKLNLSYNFTESLGIELQSTFLTSSESKSVKEIRDNNLLNAEQFVYTKSYYGVDLVWSPIYGKMTSLDRKIIPFDMYFSIGGGTSVTNSKEKNNSTLHIGTGQIFALSKSMAFRWDYSFNTFAATPQSTASNSNPSQGGYNDLIFTAGVSFFFPEAGYR